MTVDAIILAGGKGTRLRNVTRGLPKPMVPVGDKPFLVYLIDYLSQQGIKRIVLSVGYQNERITDYFGTRYKDVAIHYAVENKPLGTGGAIINAMRLIHSRNVFIFNGDTFFKIDLQSLYDFHKDKSSQFTIALKHMTNFDRYGTILLSERNNIIKFQEKKSMKTGLISGGIYLTEKNMFDNFDLPDSFSIETDFLEKYHSRLDIFGLPFDDYFIDIGLPEDYAAACRNLDIYLRD